MKKIYLSLALTSAVYANGLDVLSQYGKFDGYLRVGVQNHKVDGDKTYKQDSIGGKLSFTTKKFGDVLSGKLSAYSTNKISNNDSEGVPFFGDKQGGYTILGEAFLKAKVSDNTFKLGRMELDTPFADTDDIGMVPNTFEAFTWVNKSFKDTTFIYAGVSKQAGVDAAKPQSFTELYNNSGVDVFAVIYEGFKNTTLSGWYYDLKPSTVADLDSISYVEATYEDSINQDVTYSLSAQYANQAHKYSSDAKIVGLMASVSFENSGLTFTGAYNKSNDNTASNGFGGGPFFTSCEHTTIAEGGVDAKATDYAVEFDASKIGLNGVNLSYSHLEVKAKDGKKAKDSDFALSYDIKENLNLTAIYSDVDDTINGEKFKNTRVFVNYKF